MQSDFDACLDTAPATSFTEKGLDGIPDIIRHRSFREDTSPELTRVTAILQVCPKGQDQAGASFRGYEYLTSWFTGAAAH